MRSVCVVIICFYFYSCRGQIKPNTAQMERFDITEFNAHKIAGEFNTTLSDGTWISRFGDKSGYFEKIVPPKTWFYTYKEFYGNGSLKLEGTLFKKGDFQAGIWTEFDDRGNKMKEINYDQQYKLNVDSIFKILREKGIAFSMDDVFNSIKRGMINSKGIWQVEWKIKTDRVERMQIEDSTGKIVKQDFYLFQADN